MINITVQQQKGLGLIEVLITLVVLSIGLLGLASLQLNSLRNNQSAMQHSMAVIQTYTIIEAMQADTAIKQSNIRDFSTYNLALNATPTGNTYSDQVKRNWRTEIQNILGADATSSIACVSANCTITIQWDDSRATLGSNVQQVTTQVQL